MFGVKIALGALAFLNALYQSYAATCTAFTSQSSCTQTTMCAWSTSTGCYCNAATNLEVVFVMDSSGSVESWGWDSEKTFVKNVVNTGLSQGSYVGIVEFSDDSEIKYNFNGVQKPRTTITTLVDGLPFLNGYTATLAAVKDAISIFQTTTKSLPRIMFLITDGNPNPSTSNPCGTSTSAKNARKNLNSLNVTTLLITVGPDINAGTLSCLYNNDPSRVISANDFTAASLQAIRAKTDAYLCPTVSDLRISEVRVQVGLAGDPGGNSRYLEIYNHGQVIDFSGNALKLTGFVTGTISTGTLKNGQRLVIYDNSGTAGTDMQCNSCTCAAEETNTAGSLVNNKCTNAIYIACGATGASCSFSGSMSNTHWSQKIEDTVDKVVFVDITHDSTTNNLATVPQGFTFEVIDLLKDVSTGANWKRSCLMYGTPGDKPLTTCSAICVTSICRSSGDTSATCASSSACACTASNHYYSDQLQCTKLPPPSGCTTLVAKESDGNQYATVAWTNAGTTLEHTYTISYTYEGASAQSSSPSDTPFTVYGPNGINVLTDTAPTVKTVVEVNSVIVESVAVSCPFQTLSPTASPTLKPTKRPTVRPTIQPTKIPTSPPTGKPSKPPTPPPTNKPTSPPTVHPTVAGYDITECNIAVKAGSTSAVTVTYTLQKHASETNSQLGLTLELNLDNAPGRGAVALNAATGSPQDTSISNAAGHTFYLWPRYRAYPTTGPFTGFSRGAYCTLTTSAPTPAPTGKPSVSPTPKPTSPPTPKPTGKPTATPTKKPTYENIQVESCSVTLGRLDSNGEITTVTVEFTEPTLNPPVTPSSSNLAYLVSWGSGEKQSFGVSSKSSGSHIVSSAKNILITPDATVELTPRTKTPSADAGPATICTIFTLAPTTSPTHAPHAPTASPVKPNIQLALDDERCVAGTTDDEGRDIYVCEYEVSSGAYSVGVELTTGASDFEITYEWSISFDRAIEPKFELGTDVAIAPESDFGFLKGSNTIEASVTKGEFSLLISDKADEDIGAEVAWLTLTACSYASDYTCSIASAETHRKTYRISIVNDKGGKQTSASNKGKMPTWIWYPVAAGILMLAGLAAFGYMYYNKRKLAEEQLQQKEADLANVEELDNMENFGGLGDNITFNPIATAGTQDVATGGEYIDKQLAKQQKHAEFAQVDVDKEVWRQDFGQIKADRHEV